MLRMGEVNGRNVFSVDSILSRPDPIPSHNALFYGSYQPRGFQVRHYASPTSSSGNLGGEHKGRSYFQVDTKSRKGKRKRYNESSAEDELETLTTKRCRNESLEILGKDSQQGTSYSQYYQSRSDKMQLTCDDGLNHEPGSDIDLMDMGRRGNTQRSSLEPREEPLEDCQCKYSTEIFAEEFEDVRKNSMKEVSKMSDPQVEMTIGGVTVSLQNSDLWTEFHYSGTEMIINRAGRRMFPRISVKVTGLKADVVYQVLLLFERSDRRRYKFVNGKWHTTQIMEVQETGQIYIHPNSPNTGSFWMKDDICFSKLKITNNPDPEGSNVFLQSMYKYIPHIIIKETSDPFDVEDIEKNRNDSSANVEPLSSLSRNHYKFCFPVTSFIAVTAYQNEKITHLKIKNNPFAKAFREPDKASLQHNIYGSCNISQHSPKEGFPLHHPLRNAESLGCMPTSSLPFQCYNWSDARTFVTKSLLHLSRTPSSQSHTTASLDHLPLRTPLYTSNTYLKAERSPYVRNLSSSFSSVRSARLSASTSSVLWEHDSAYGSLNSVYDHHV